MLGRLGETEMKNQLHRMKLQSLAVLLILAASTVALLMNGCSSSKDSGYSTSNTTNPRTEDVDTTETNTVSVPISMKSSGMAIPEDIHYVYDSSNNNIIKYTFYDDGSFKHYTTIDYDENNRIIRENVYSIRQFDVTNNTVSLGNIVSYTTYEYDENGEYVRKEYKEITNKGSGQNRYEMKCECRCQPDGTELEGIFIEGSIDRGNSGDVYDSSGDFIERDEGAAAPGWPAPHEYKYKVSFEYVKDAKGRVIEKNAHYSLLDDAEVDGNKSSYTLNERYTYNSDGSAKYETGKDGEYSTYYSVRDYDMNGNIVRETGYTPSGTEEYDYEYKYEYGSPEEANAVNDIRAS